MRLLVASNNQGKIREIKSILEGEIEVLSPLDISLDLSILESGKTLQENAIKKGLAYFRHSRICSLGEDTGLEVEALDGKPGVNSARYSGSGDEENRKKLLKELWGRDDRRACFRTVMALVIQEGWIECFEGVMRGKISRSERGRAGFGYDPIFIPDGFNKTFGEMDCGEKNKISHRRMALEKVLSFIQREWDEVEKFCK